MSIHLPASEIHIWTVRDKDIVDPDILARYAELLSAAERVQQQRFYFAKHRHQYLVTRALLRSTLSLYVDTIAPAAWCFNKNDYGRPAIANTLAAPLHFNLSHTEGLIALAISNHVETGIDVEWLARSGSTIELAERFFSAIETQQLLALPAAHQRQRFFNLWTLKEAYIKACGMGLSIPLQDFSYSFPAPGEVAIDFCAQRDDQPERWQFWTLAPTNYYQLSLATKTAIAQQSLQLCAREIIPLEPFSEVAYPVILRSRSQNNAVNTLVACS